MTDILVLILFILSGAASGWLGVDLLPVDILKQVSNVEGFRIVLAIIAKHKNIQMQFDLYEKSFKKSQFLNHVVKKFNLKAKILQKDIFEEKNLVTDLIVARAFKPLPIILKLANSNFKKFKSLILFLGRNDKNLIKESLKEWSFEYKEKKYYE